MDQLANEIAHSLDARIELLPYIPDLLRDLPDLGTSPERIARLLMPHVNPGSKFHCLDLACGRGAVSLYLAEKFGASVIGVDAFKPFIDEARLLARNLEVDELCTFRCEDIRNILKEPESFDVVVWGDPGDLFGPIDQLISTLDKLVEPGGFLLIDYMISRTIPYGDTHPDFNTAVSLINKTGYELLASFSDDDAETIRTNQEYLKSIRLQAFRLARLYPDHANSFFSYVEAQERANADILEKYRPIIWLLHKPA